MEWIDFKDKKPENNQVCIVSAGLDNHAQVLAVRWDAYDEEFYWAEDIGLEPYPTEETNMWMPFPSDPIKTP